MRLLLARGLKPTAIFAATDELAIGAIRVLYEAGCAVPRDVSVIGFDDSREAPFADPPLTTIRQPVRAIGEQAARWLIRDLHSQSREPLQCRIQPSLIERNTVGPPPCGP